MEETPRSSNMPSATPELLPSADCSAARMSLLARSTQHRQRRICFFKWNIRATARAFGDLLGCGRCRTMIDCDVAQNSTARWVAQILTFVHSLQGALGSIT